MSPAFAAEVARYQEMPDWALNGLVAEMERMLAAQQSMLAAARKAQKNQKRAAKKERKE